MASLGSLISGFSKLLTRSTGVSTIPMRNETTTGNPRLIGMQWDKWLNAKMLRDVKRRRLAKEHAPMRLRLISLKRNDILPREIQEIASKDMDEIPRQAALRQLTYRCVLTSRGKGTVIRWGLSRIVFRDIADHNKLSGIQRAMW